MSVCAEMIVMEGSLRMRGAQEPALVPLVFLLEVHVNFCGLGHSIVHIVSMQIQSPPVSPPFQGQLGRGKGLGSCTPLSIPMHSLLDSNERIAEVACGANHSAIVTNMGVLITFGAGMHGQILCTTHFSFLNFIISVWKLKISILCFCRPDRAWSL